MPTANVIQINVYEIHSLSVFCLFLLCKTKRESVLSLAIKFLRHQKDIQRILCCSSYNVSLLTGSSGNKQKYIFSLNMLVYKYNCVNLRDKHQRKLLKEKT